MPALLMTTSSPSNATMILPKACSTCPRSATSARKVPMIPGKFLANLVAEVFIAIENSHTRAFFEKASGGGGSDAAGASGDDHSFALESAHRLQLRSEANLSDGYNNKRRFDAGHCANLAFVSSLPVTVITC